MYRWHNHLNPTINKEAWTQEEELALIHYHQIFGNKWAELSKYIPGRYICILNYFSVNCEHAVKPLHIELLFYFIDVPRHIRNLDSQSVAGSDMRKTIKF